MKLLYCEKCKDVINLTNKNKTCRCLAVQGRLKGFREIETQPKDSTIITIDEQELFRAIETLPFMSQTYLTATIRKEKT